MAKDKKKKISEMWVCMDCKKEISKDQLNRPWIIDTIAEKNKYISELLAEIENLKGSIGSCPHCGTTELLCGYPRHCSSDKNKEND